MFLFMIFAFCGINVLIVNADCISNNKLLKEKLENKKIDYSKPPTKSLELSLKLQRLELTPQFEALVDGFMTKKYVDSDLDYSNLFPCDEYAIVRTDDITTLNSPNVSLMNGQIISGQKTDINAVVFPNGTVYQTSRITLLSPCIWNISSPFPLSKCQLIWHNLNFHQNEMFVIWSDGIFEHTSALQNGIQNSGKYQIKKLDFIHNIIRKSVGDFDEIVFVMEFERSKMKELVLFYLPQIMFVCISWLSMFLGPMAITRSILIIGSMILLILHRYFFSPVFGSTNEFSSFDIWHFGTFIFTFIILMELILITCMASFGRSKRLLSIFNNNDKKASGRNYYSFEPLYEELNDLRNRKSRQTCACCSYSALAVDIISLSVLAAGFCMFVALYFFSTETLTNFANSFNFETNSSIIGNIDGKLK